MSAEQPQPECPEHAGTKTVALAREWIGTPYRHQASLQGVGCDCLGLVRGVWRTLYGSEAAPVPGYSRDWGEADRAETLLAAAQRHLIARAAQDPQPGDVLLFRMRPEVSAKHMAIYCGNDMMIHAQEGVSVSEVTLGRWWRRRIAAVFFFPGSAD